MVKQFAWSDKTGNVKITFNGNGLETITIESDKNSTGVTRTMNLAVKTVDNKIIHNITITQFAADAREFSLDFSSDFKL